MFTLSKYGDIIIFGNAGEILILFRLHLASSVLAVLVRFLFILI